MAAPNLSQAVVVQGQLDDVRAQLEAAAAGTRYELAEQRYAGFELRRRRIPGWAIALAVVFFPFGLAFLVARTVDVVDVSLERAANGTQVRMDGRASPMLRRALYGALGGFQAAGAPAPRWPAAAPEAPTAAAAPEAPQAAVAPSSPQAAAPVPEAVPPPEAAAAPPPAVAPARAAPPPPPVTPPLAPPFGGPPGGMPPMPLGPIGGSYPPPSPPPGGQLPGP